MLKSTDEEKLITNFGRYNQQETLSFALVKCNYSDLKCSSWRPHNNRPTKRSKNIQRLLLLRADLLHLRDIQIHKKNQWCTPLFHCEQNECRRYCRRYGWFVTRIICWKKSNCNFLAIFGNESSRIRICSLKVITSCAQNESMYWNTIAVIESNGCITKNVWFSQIVQ